MNKILYSIMGNSQKLDGGAMFGNVPKVLWQKWVEVDEQNRIDLACRALLVVDKALGKNILFETGIGAFFEPKLKQRFGVQESEHILLESLAKHGFEHSDIDYVVLSHLHFDHAGGLLSAWQQDKSAELLFPNAQFLVGEKAWQRAKKPHPRDRASFIPELCGLLEQTGRLQLIPDEESPEENNEADQYLGVDYRFSFSDGHTPGMMLSEIKLEEGSLVFAADLIPATPWVHLPITMGYDRFPEALIDEKSALLSRLIADKGALFFTHDPKVAAAWLEKDDKGRYFTQSELINIIK